MGSFFRDYIEEGSATFQTIRQSSPPNSDTEDEKRDEYYEALKNEANFECLDKDEEELKQPFEKIALEMQNVTGNGTIKKRVLRKGYGPRAEIGSVVTLNYNAYVEFEAYPFDSTYARKKPFSFTVDNGEVIRGLELAVRTMQINEKSRFLIVPELAFKDSGMGRIPPNSSVLFEIELGEVLESVPENGPLNCENFEQTYKVCMALCVQGKQHFRLQDYDSAVKNYNIATEKLEDAILNDYQEQEKSDDLLNRLYTNLLICYTHQGVPKRGCFFANKIYQMAKNGGIEVSNKVYFNNARCLRLLGDFRLAKERLEQARKSDPGNPLIKQEFLAIEKAKEEYKKKMAAIGKAFLS